MYSDPIRQNLIDLIKGVIPTRVGTLTYGVTSGDKDIYVNGVQSFPPQGTIVIERNSPAEEYIDYLAVVKGDDCLQGCSRGVSGTSPSAHPTAALVELVYPLPKQDAYFSENKESAPHRRPDEIALEDYMRALSKND